MAYYCAFSVSTEIWLHPVQVVQLLLSSIRLCVWDQAEISHYTCYVGTKDEVVVVDKDNII